MENLNLVDTPALLKLQGKRPSLFVLILLGIIALSSIVLGLLMIVLSPWEVKFGAIFFALLLLACGVFLGRTLVWNIYGKCVIKSDGDSIIQYFDYHFFRSSENKCKISDFGVSQIELTPKVSKIVLQFGEKEVFVPFEYSTELAMNNLSELRSKFIG